MANRVASPNLFAPNPPNWSLAQLDANAQAATGAINDSSLGAVNGPLADTGAVNAYAVTCSYGSPSAYNNGMTVFFNPANTNTGASTLTVSPLSSLPIVTGTGTALAGGEIQAGATTGVVCDGSAFRIFSVPSTPLITAVRLRSFNAVGNPTFEVDQRNAGNTIATAPNGSWFLDRWSLWKPGGTYQVTIGRGTPGVVSVPGTNFAISNYSSTLQLTTQQASLAAGDALQMFQAIEGSAFRELSNDVHSISLLVYTSVANLKFSVSLQNAATSRSFVHLCTVPSANTWTLITIPNIPVWVSGGGWTVTPGSVGYYLGITLAAGTNFVAASADTWVSTNSIAAPGATNFVGQAVNSTFYCAFVQHEPGPNCTTLIDCPFGVNLDGSLGCSRYYQKSYDYGIKAGTANGAGALVYGTSAANANPLYGLIAFRKAMAKAPTVSVYSLTTGALNNVRDAGSSSDRAVATIPGIGENGFPGVTLTTPNTSATNYQFHWVADSGW